MVSIKIFNQQFKKSVCWLIVGSQFLLGMQSVFAITILPFGDSITEGYIHVSPWWVPGGYRNKFYADMTAEKISINYTGVFTSNSSTTLNAVNQNLHIGAWGWHINELNASLLGAPLASTKVFSQPWAKADTGKWLTRMESAGKKADIILYLAGTNDITAKASIDTISARITKSLSIFNTNLPNAVVFIGLLIPRKDSLNYKVIAVNNAIKNTIVPNWNTAHPSNKISTVDMYSIFFDSVNNKLRLMADTLHPSAVGYDSIGATWARAVKSYLKTTSLHRNPQISTPSNMFEVSPNGTIDLRGRIRTNSKNLVGLYVGH